VLVPAFSFETDEPESKLVWGRIRMLREIADDSNAGFAGTIRVMTTLEFLQHHFPEMDHRDVLLTRDPFEP